MVPNFSLNYEKTQILTPLKNTNCDKIKNLNCEKKLKHSNCDNLKTEIVNTKNIYVKKLKLLQNSTENVTNLKDSDCNKTQKPKLRLN